MTNKSRNQMEKCPASEYVAHGNHAKTYDAGDSTPSLVLALRLSERSWIPQKLKLESICPLGLFMVGCKFRPAAYDGRQVFINTFIS
jgi:hypothetical protein